MQLTFFHPESDWLPPATFPDLTQQKEIAIDLDGGIRRGTHILKAMALGATACSGGRMYLFALAAAGRKGVEKALENIRTEVERDMKLMGCTKISDLSRKNLRFRK